MNQKQKSHYEFSQPGDKAMLLIEDTPALIEKVRQKLETKGFIVWTVYSLEEALYCLESGLDNDNGIIVFFLEKQ